MSSPPLDPARLTGAAPFQHLLRRLSEDHEASVGGLWGSSQALVLAALAQHSSAPYLVLASTTAEAEACAEDLATLGLEPTLFPARDSYTSGGAGRGGAHADAEAIRQRLQVSQRLSGPPDRRPRLLVAPLLSLLQPIHDPRLLESQFLHLQKGARLDPEDLLGRLVGSGYTRQPLAERPGEVSLRGDILDLFAFASELPLRVELFDDRIEDLRTFDPESQRSVETLDRIAVCLARDAGGVEDGQGVQAVQLLSPATVFVRIEPLRIEDQAEGQRIRSTAHARALLELERSTRKLTRVDLQSLPSGDVDFATRSVQSLSVGARQAPEALAAATAGGEQAVVLCRNEAERERFAELIDAARAKGHWPGTIDVRVGSLASGFRLLELGLVVINHHELAGVALGRAQHKQRPAHRARMLQSFFELKLGDLVVHAVHGLARYAGLKRIERNGAEEDHLHLLFADEVSLFVPASLVDLVQRYIGTGGGTPALDKIGAPTFRRRREKVEKALADLAAELLEVQALRELRQRPAWPADDELVTAMIAEFPYTETPDQVTVDVELGADLRAERSMDRLLCGDVGFGKTELAMRAAFRVVNGGGQVAVLVPTTVLAQQHFETFSERFADFPVEVGVISRTTTGKRLQELLARAALGEVDILIGTHRLLSKDVGLPGLGLVIIDEEQRFGVTHKEHFKRLRGTCDLLTLTATPIPRTLHMSLSGVRDISALSIAPPGRQEIETRLIEAEDDELIGEAILREKNRGGQVFFLHNRVQSIERVAGELARLVPECTFIVGHGQMGGRELARVMGSFAHGAVDVLVATTIIENGIDIPAAGTILIDRADTLGLSELHQLRGRVGRGRHKSWCYLLIERTRPISEVSRKRLSALEEMSHLGAGFQISMKDLEIRGAGNILGPQQSGHIAAVGYDLYCRLLKGAVERLHRGGVVGELFVGVELELGITAYLPETWIPEADTRLEILRQLDTIASDADAAEAEALLRDRFGRVPPEALALLHQFRLRARLLELGIRQLAWRGEVFVVGYADRVALESALGSGNGKNPELRPLRAGLAHLVIPARARTAETALDWLEGLLSPGAPEPTMGA